MNSIISTKYNLPPETIERRSLDKKEGDYFREVYDFMRVCKIETKQTKNLKYDQKKDKGRKRLRSPLELNEKVPALAERLKKKDAPGVLYKVSTENIPFFNRDRIFTIYKRAKLENGIYLYWLKKNGRKIDGRFLRQELFALNKQFLS